MSEISASGWLIQIPLSELLALQSLPLEMDKLKAENQQLRREIEGLRRVQSEALQVLGDVRRSLRKL